MNKKIKTAIITAACLVGATALAAGIILLVNGGFGKTCKVFSVAEISMSDYWGDGLSSSGYVKADRMQTVYLSDTQKISSINVTVNQEVKAGDVLMSYDTTLSDLELKRAEIELQRGQLTLQQLYQHLNWINGLKPFVPPPETEPTEPETEPLEPHATPYLYKGTGTVDDPYIYLWSDTDTYTAQFVADLAKDLPLPAAVYTVFGVTENNSLKGDVLRYWGICFEYTDQGTTFRIMEVPEPEFHELVPVPEEPTTEETSMYTAEEIAAMRIETEKEIRDQELKNKLADVDYQRMVKEVKDGSIYAEFDGVISQVLTENEAKEKNSPIVVLAGGGGFYIEGAISELKMDQISVGQAVTLTNWETDEVLDGEITAISDKPVEGGSFYNGNPNVTNYGFTVFVDGSHFLREGTYMDISISAGQSESGWYLNSAFISREGGKSYVFVRNAEGKLEKRAVTTGKNLWGEYTQIRSGLDMEDWIAFPYGSAAKEGAATAEAGLDELYN
ncbi:MAG: biotin/lipoyl-binding protein [Parasporobacterium sp.]|nr:biotin/lipoyl-binding protein [Parasporobacterium sp.]